MKTIKILMLIIAIELVIIVSIVLLSKEVDAQILENCWGCDEQQKQTKYLKYLAEQASDQEARESMRELTRQTERYYEEQDRRREHDQRQRAIRDFLNDSGLDSDE